MPLAPCSTQAIDFVQLFEIVRRIERRLGRSLVDGDRDTRARQRSARSELALFNQIVSSRICNESDIEQHAFLDLAFERRCRAKGDCEFIAGALLEFRAELVPHGL